MDRILCSVATYGRYDTTLPMVIHAIAMQTRAPDKLIIFDDNKQPEDLRSRFIYQHLFNILDEKKIPWEVKYAPKKGQHHIHQIANTMGYDWVWRVDDDCVPEPNVLKILSTYITNKTGAIGGPILTPPILRNTATGKIKNLDTEPNIQWGRILYPAQVEHLHCSFLYRAGVADFALGLSQVAHREETLFTYSLARKGYRIMAVPDAISWHLKAPTGGIRSGFSQDMFDHDERIFRNFLKFMQEDKTIVVLNCGKGDHLVFSHILPEIKNPEVFTCYPDIVPGRPLAEAMNLFGNIDQWSIYAKMDQWKWKGPLENAFRKMYL